MAEKNYERLSDGILAALTISLEQKDLAISEMLSRALEMAMTRGAGGKEFVERRVFAEDVERALTQIEILRKEAHG